MTRCIRYRFALCLFFIIVPLFTAESARSQSNGLVLTRSEEVDLDSLASHIAQRIQEAKSDEEEPKVLVIDFFRSSPGNPSQLGEFLADRFSASLSGYAAGLKILDRKILKDYLTREWTTLEDLQSNEVCLRIGRQMGATGVILGTLYEENGFLSVSVHLGGSGRIAKDKDGLSVTDERIRFPMTEEMHAMLFEPGPNYTRKPDEIPEEPGIVRAGLQGVTSPVCIYCPQPDYSDAARAGKIQGTVRLSIVVTADGHAKAVYVLKGAPFGLTGQAIKATREWRFKPAQKDGTPVSSRVEVETTFHLY
jgi:TonB family protein